MKYQVRYSLYSHVGKVRKMNQDNYMCAGIIAKADEPSMPSVISGVTQLDGLPVFGVFDGLGGEQKGEVAAYLAAELASRTLTCGAGKKELATYCKAANQEIFSFSKANGISRMATTAVLMSFCEDIVFLCNIGDSKAFRYHCGELYQLSEDHVISPAPGVKGPLFQALGVSPDEYSIEPYFSHGKPAWGEKYLLCSDGLTDMLSEQDICRELKSDQFELTVERMADLALQNGGKDNITILLCMIEPCNTLERMTKPDRRAS